MEEGRDVRAKVVHEPSSEASLCTFFYLAAVKLDSQYLAVLFCHFSRTEEENSSIYSLISFISFICYLFLTETQGR